MGDDPVRSEIDAFLSGNGKQLQQPSEGEEDLTLSEEEEVESPSPESVTSLLEEIEKGQNPPVGDDDPDPPEEEEEEVEEEEVDEDEDELTRTARQRDQLLQMVNDLAERRLAPQTTQVDGEENPQDLPPTTPSSPPLTPEQFEEVISSPEALDSYVEAKISRAVQGAVTTINTAVSKNLVTRERVHRFFDSPDNADVSTIPSYVLQKAMEIEAENPALTKQKNGLDEVLRLAAERSRKELGLAKLKTSTRQQRVPSAAQQAAGRFPSATRAGTRPSRGGEKKVDPIQAEIDRMKKVIQGH